MDRTNWGGAFVEKDVKQEGAGKGKIALFIKNRTFCVSEKRAGYGFRVLMGEKL
jgi:hypothetical protein